MIFWKKKKVSFYHHVSYPQETVIHGISFLSETNIFLSHTSPSPNQLNSKISETAFHQCLTPTSPQITVS